MRILGENIKILCIQKGITYGELAEMAEITKSTVLNLVSERSSPSKSTLEGLAKAFGITQEMLLSVNFGYTMNDMRIEKIAENIRSLCLMKSMTYEQLSEKAEISYDVIKKLINCKRMAHINTIIKIAKALGVKANELIFGNFGEYELSAINVGRNIRRICSERGISIKELQIKAKIKERTMYNILNDVTCANKATIRKIAEALDVIPYELVKNQVA